MTGCQINNGKVSWAYTPSSCSSKDLTEDQVRDHVIGTGETINTGTWWSLVAFGGSSVAALLLYFLGGRSDNDGLSKLGHAGVLGALVSAGSAIYFYATRLNPDVHGDGSMEKNKHVNKDINQQLINLGKDNNDLNSRTLAAHELGNSNNIDAVAPLKNVLVDPADAKEVRAQSAVSLGKLGAFGVITDLINCLSDPESSVRIGAIQAIGLLAEKDPVKASKALKPLKDLFENTQSIEEKSWIALTLSRFSPDQVKDLLLKDENINHSNTGLRQAVTVSLATLLQRTSDTEIIKALANRLEVESEPDTCEIIINSFKNITDTNKQKETVPSLCKFLARNTDEDLQESTIQLLGKFNASEAINPILEHGLKSQSNKVRVAALKALRQLCVNNPGNPDTIEVVNVLKQLQKKANGKSRKVINIAINEIVTANPSLFAKSKTSKTTQPAKSASSPTGQSSSPAPQPAKSASSSTGQSSSPTPQPAKPSPTPQPVQSSPTPQPAKPSPALNNDDDVVGLDLDVADDDSAISQTPAADNDSEFDLSLPEEEPVHSQNNNEPVISSPKPDNEPIVASPISDNEPKDPLELLKDADPEKAKQAAKDCRNLGLAAIDTLLSNGLTHSDDKVKLATIDTLVEICNKNPDSSRVQEIANRLRNFANGSSGEVQTKAAKAASDLTIEQSIKILKNDPSIQPKTIPATTEQTIIFESLKNTDPTKAKEAAEACGKFGLAAIEPLLRHGLSHGNNDVKIAAINALGKICSENPLAREVQSVLVKLEQIEHNQSYSSYSVADAARSTKESIQSAVKNKVSSAVQQLIDLRYTSDPPSDDKRIFPLLLGFIRNASSNPDTARAVVERLANASIKTTNKDCIDELRLLVAELKRVTINDNNSYSGYSSQKTKERAINNIEKALNEHASNERAALQAQQLQDQDASISQRKRALEQLFKSRYTNRSANDDTKDIAGVHNQLIECLEGKQGKELQEEVIRILGDPYTTIPTQVSGPSYKRFLLDTSIANELCKMLETLKNLNTPVKGKDDAIRKLEDFVKAYTAGKISDITNNNGKKGTVWTQEGLVTSLNNTLNNLPSLHPVLAVEIKKIVFEKLKNIACGIEKENGNPFCLSARKSALDALTKAGFTFETIPPEIINLLAPARKDYQALEIEFHKTLLSMAPASSDEASTLITQFLRSMGLPRDASKVNIIFNAIKNHEVGRTSDLDRLISSAIPRKSIDLNDLQKEKTGILKSIVNYCQPSYSWTQSLPTPQGFLQALQESEYGNHSRLEKIIDGFVTEHNKSAGTPEQLAIKKLLDSCEYDSLKGDALHETLTFAIKNKNFANLDAFIDDFVKSNNLSVSTEEIRNELIKTCRSFPNHSDQEKLKQHLSEKYKKINDRLDPVKVKSDAIQAYKQLKQKHDPETVKKELLDAYKALNDELQKVNESLCIGLMKIGANSPIDTKFITGLITCASNNDEKPKVQEAAKQVLSKFDADKLKPLDEKTKERIQEITGRDDLIAPKPAPVQNTAGTAPAIAPANTTKEQTPPTSKKAVGTPKAKQTPQKFIMDAIGGGNPWDVVNKCHDIFEAHKDGKSGFDREVTRTTYFIISNLARSDNNDSRSRTNAAGIISDINKSGRHLHLEEAPMEYIRSEVSKEQTHQGLVNKYLELYNLHKDGNTVFDTEVCMLAYTSLSNFASGGLMYADVKSTNDDINVARLHAKKQIEQIQNPPVKIKDSAAEYIKEVVSNQHTHRDLVDKYLELYKTHMNKDSDFDKEVCAISYEALISFTSGSSMKSDTYWIPDSLDLPWEMSNKAKSEKITGKIIEKRTAREYASKELLQIQPPAKYTGDIESLRKALISTLDPPDVRLNTISIVMKNNMPIDIDDLILCICTKEVDLSSYRPPETEQEKAIERDNDRQLEQACSGVTIKKELVETEFQGGDYKSVTVKAVNDTKVRLKAIELLIDRVKNGSIPASDLLKDISLGPVRAFKTKTNSLGQEKKIAVTEEGFVSLLRTVSNQNEPEEVRLKILDLIGVIFKKAEMNEPETVSTILKCLGEEATRTSNSANIRTKCRNLLDTLAQKVNVPTGAQQAVA